MPASPTLRGTASFGSPRALFETFLQNYIHVIPSVSFVSNCCDCLSTVSLAPQPVEINDRQLALVAAHRALGRVIPAVPRSAARGAQFLGSLARRDAVRADVRPSGRQGVEIVDKWGVVGQSGGPWGGAHVRGETPTEI